MRLRRYIILSLMAAACVAACARSISSGPGGVPIGSVTLLGDADSLFEHAVGALPAEGYTIVAVDTSRRVLVVRAASGPAEDINVAIYPKADSSTIVVHGRQGGMAALLIGMHAIQVITRDPTLEAAELPEGSDWITDEHGRVGFLLFTAAGAEAIGIQPVDTAFEVRASDIAADFRRELERGIIAASFDPSCARLFQVASFYVLRFNMCSAPEPKYDRMSIYDANGRLLRGTIGPAVAERIALMCPSARPPTPESRCPRPFR